MPGRILELGRSCVDTGYRNRSVMQLLWRGIAAYVFQHRIELMFGCASLPGHRPRYAFALELTYLILLITLRHPLPSGRARCRTVTSKCAGWTATTINARAALIGRLPPLIKGYLRLGGFIGDGAVIDAQFNTTDVAVVVQTDLVTEKYYKPL